MLRAAIEIHDFSAKAGTLAGVLGLFFLGAGRGTISGRVSRAAKCLALPARLALTGS